MKTELFLVALEVQGLLFIRIKTQKTTKAPLIFWRFLKSKMIKTPKQVKYIAMLIFPQP